MILIADSGSTKADWRLICADGKIHPFSSEGINPYFHTASTITKTLRGFSVEPFQHEDIIEVHFYGAGCSFERNLKIMYDGFTPVFTNAKIYIYHDLLGASRALFPTGSGIAAILGTGSNSCLYIDDEIKLSLGGNGYILGDEGSGMHLGRKVIRDFMNDLMPADVLERFQKTYGLTKAEITYAVYKKEFPNRFLASFSKFVLNNIDMPYMQEVARDVFFKFFDRYVSKYPDYQKYPLRIVGSIGYFFKKQIQQQADDFGIKLDKIIRAPIEGLLEYHMR